MEYLAGQYRVTCPVCPSPQVRPFMTPHLGDLRDLPVTLAAMVIIINRGLFLHSFLPLAQCNYEHQVLPALEWTLPVKYAASFRKMQLVSRT